jgi:hypothetical protein
MLDAVAVRVQFDVGATDMFRTDRAQNEQKNGAYT